MADNPYHHFKSIHDLVDEVVNKHMPSGDINASSKQFKRIQASWPDCAPEMICQNVKPVRLDNGTLVVETHSPVWANNARYTMKSCLVKLHALGFDEIEYIKVRVNPK